MSWGWILQPLRSRYPLLGDGEGLEPKRSRATGGGKDEGEVDRDME